MDLLIVRHGIAEPRSPQLQDALRPLTHAGRERFRRCVAGLGALGIELDGLFHSPWQRAVETAVELQALGGVEAYGTALLADAPTEALFELVRGRRCAALVGHEPWTSDLLDLAVGGYCGTTFKKGGVAWLRGAPEAGELELLALLPPRVLVKLA